MDNIADVTNKLLQRCRASEVEIEARIRKHLVNEGSHALLLSNLGIEWSKEVYTERRRISNTSRKCAYRQRSKPSSPDSQPRAATSKLRAANSTTICKSSIAKEDINDSWCTLHVSVETPVPSMSRTLTGLPPVSVTRYRGEMEGHYIDAIHDKGQGYRVEVEVCDPINFDPDSTLRVVRRVCTVLQGSRCFVKYYDWFTVMHVAKTPFGKFCIDSGDYQKPRTMTMDALSEMAASLGSWVVTPKVDGERRFIVALGSRVFSVGTARNVRFESEAPDNNGVLILDCEYTVKNDTFHVFDVVVRDGAYLGEEGNLLERLDMAEEICATMDGRIGVKAHHGFDSFDRLSELYEEFKRSSSYGIDGMIFVNTGKGYMQQVPKWKQHSTVDLMVVDGRLTTCDGWNVDVPIGAENDLANGVWEFRYDRDGGVLVPERPRPDKPQANSKNIVETNMLRAVPGSVFSGVGCYLMRKYHNRVKAAMIKGANDKNAVILDVGTGQGGDVGKWGRAAAVYCIEPSVLSTRDMLDRHGRMENVSIVNVHLRDLDHARINKKVDVFTAFFCMNQFQDADWEALKRLVAAKGSSRCRLLAIAMTSPKTHKGGCFEIRMNGLDSYNIRIHNTRIDGIDERVVNPSMLTATMHKCGLELFEHGRLDTDDFMSREERRLSSMYEMFVYKKKRARPAQDCR